MSENRIRQSMPHMIAHRGFSGKEAENTCGAFIAAGNRECYYGIETDIHVTQDGSFVLIHDDDTARVADRSLSVEDSTELQLSKVHLLDIDGQVGRRDLVIPMLSDYLTICRRYNKQCIAELKNPFTQEQIKRVLAEFDKENDLEHTIMISFSLANLKTLRVMRPELRLQYLVEEELPEDLMQTLDTYDLDLDCDYHLLNKNLVEQIHISGHLVNCWTVNNVQDAMDMTQIGVDFITTNILELETK